MAIAQLLMKEGADVRGRNKLSWAAASGCEAVAKLLLESGTVEAGSRDDTSRTPPREGMIPW